MSKAEAAAKAEERRQGERWVPVRWYDVDGKGVIATLPSDGQRPSYRAWWRNLPPEAFVSFEEAKRWLADRGSRGIEAAEYERRSGITTATVRRYGDAWEWELFAGPGAHAPVRVGPFRAADAAVAMKAAERVAEAIRQSVADTWDSWRERI